jgi:DNA polymerase-3 subunit gamma/tau
MLSQAAFNAFLKTLEEPPHYAIFILATTEKHKVLPTILSRCQIHDFKRVSIDDIIPFLENICRKEDIAYDRDGLYIIAQKADGALRDALSIFDKAVSFGNGKVDLETVLESLNVLDSDAFFSITDSLQAADVPAVLNHYNDIVSRGFEGDVFIEGLGQHLRDLLVCKSPDTAKLLEVTGRYRQRYAEQAQAVEGETILRWLQVLNQADVNYRMSRNKRLHVELALIRMAGAPAAELKKKERPPTSTGLREPVPPVPARTELMKTFDKTAPKAEVVAATGDRLTSYERHKRQALKPKEEDVALVEHIVGEQLEVESIARAWRAAIDRYKSEKRAALATTMERYQPEQVEPSRLRVTVTNNRDLEHLQEVKLDLAAYIKSSLGARSLVLELVHQPSDVVASTELKPYTDRDKFEAMAKKNPAVMALKDKLDLEFEF